MLVLVATVNMKNWREDQDLVDLALCEVKSLKAYAEKRNKVEILIRELYNTYRDYSGEWKGKSVSNDAMFVIKV